MITYQVHVLQFPCRTEPPELSGCHGRLVQAYPPVSPSTTVLAGSQVHVGKSLPLLGVYAAMTYNITMRYQPCIRGYRRDIVS